MNPTEMDHEADAIDSQATAIEDAAAPPPSSGASRLPPGSAPPSGAMLAGSYPVPLDDEPPPDDSQFDELDPHAGPLWRVSASLTAGAASEADELADSDTDSEPVPDPPAPRHFATVAAALLPTSARLPSFAPVVADPAEPVDELEPAAASMPEPEAEAELAPDVAEGPRTPCVKPVELDLELEWPADAQWDMRLVYDGPEGHCEYPLQQHAINIIGCNPTPHLEDLRHFVTVPYTAVSRNHVALASLTPYAIGVVDMGSTSGTYIAPRANWPPIKVEPTTFESQQPPIPLFPGQVLYLGPHAFTLVSSVMPPPPPSLPPAELEPSVPIGTETQPLPISSSQTQARGADTPPAPIGSSQTQARPSFFLVGSQETGFLAADGSATPVSAAASHAHPASLLPASTPKPGLLAFSGSPIQPTPVAQRTPGLNSASTDPMLADGNQFDTTHVFVDAGDDTHDFGAAAADEVIGSPEIISRSGTGRLSSLGSDPAAPPRPPSFSALDFGTAAAAIAPKDSGLRLATLEPNNTLSTVTTLESNISVLLQQPQDGLAPASTPALGLVPDTDAMDADAAGETTPTAASMQAQAVIDDDDAERAPVGESAASVMDLDPTPRPPKDAASAPESVDGSSQLPAANQAAVDAETDSIAPELLLVAPAPATTPATAASSSLPAPAAPLAAATASADPVPAPAPTAPKSRKQAHPKRLGSLSTLSQPSDVSSQMLSPTTTDGPTFFAPISATTARTRASASPAPAPASAPEDELMGDITITSPPPRAKRTRSASSNGNASDMGNDSSIFDLSFAPAPPPPPRAKRSLTRSPAVPASIVGDLDSQASSNIGLSPLLPAMRAPEPEPELESEPPAKHPRRSATLATTRPVSPTRTMPARETRSRSLRLTDAAAAAADDSAAESVASSSSTSSKSRTRTGAITAIASSAEPPTASSSSSASSGTVPAAEPEQAVPEPAKPAARGRRKAAAKFAAEPTPSPAPAAAPAKATRKRKSRADTAAADDTPAADDEDEPAAPAPAARNRASSRRLAELALAADTASTPPAAVSAPAEQPEPEPEPEDMVTPPLKKLRTKRGSSSAASTATATPASTAPSSAATTPRPTTAGRRKRSNGSGSASSSSTPAAGAAAAPRIRVMFTGGDLASKHEKFVASHGGEIVSKWEDCDVVVCDKVRRTVKFLCALANGRDLVSGDWLVASKKAKRLLSLDDPAELAKYALADDDGEATYGFSLAHSVAQAREHRVFDGYRFYVSDGTKPLRADMRLIVEAAGGEWVDSVPSVKYDAARDAHLILVVAREDPNTVRKLRNLGYPLHTAEVVLTGILRQQVLLGGEFATEDGAPGPKVGVGLPVSKRARAAKTRGS
ncbi:Mediator of DNA damage checkpoint protein 1 [Blastocladiella emersonii ATCC 22665]|nr:Mediator of DNA damage checkpoint protein 1 [Blastocladiella emersonii ATCC 22665]